MVCEIQQSDTHIVYLTSVLGKIIPAPKDIQVRLCNPIVAHQGPLSMGFSRQEYWSGLPFPSLEHLPNLVIEPKFPVFCIGGWILQPWATWEALR